jgi:hypothetical protein
LDLWEHGGQLFAHPPATVHAVYLALRSHLTTTKSLGTAPAEFPIEYPFVGEQDKGWTLQLTCTPTSQGEQEIFCQDCPQPLESVLGLVTLVYPISVSYYLYLILTLHL